MRVAQIPRTQAVPVYELRESHAQPFIDCSTCVKDVLLPPRWLARCNYAIHKSRRVVSLVYALSLVPGWACTYVDASTGRVMGYVVLVLQSWSLLIISLMLRYDMVRVLAGTYEFWYMTLINAVTNALACAKYSDARLIIPALAFVGYQNVLLADANLRGTQNLIVLSVVSGVILLGYTLYVAFDLIDKPRHIVLWSRGGWYVEDSDLIANGMLTIIVMMWRNAYRKSRQIAPSANGGASVVRCISYRCRVRLVEQGSRRVNRTVVQPATLEAPANTQTRSQLRVAQPGQLFASDRVVSSRLWNCVQIRARSARFLYGALTWGSAAASIIAFIQPGFTVLSVAAVLTSAVHLSFCISLCQRQLLRKLIASFDVAFISIQFSLMLLSMSYLQDWDHRCLGMLNCWLWIHWVLLLDALTPVTKSTLGVHHLLAVAAVGLLILSQVLIAVDIVFLQRWQLKDRILFTIHVGRHALPLRVASFMLSRIFSVFWWFWRLLWRLVARNENEMILIQEAVEYDDIRRPRDHKPKQRAAVEPTASVVPS